MSIAQPERNKLETPYLTAKNDSNQPEERIVVIFYGNVRAERTKYQPYIVS